MSQLLARLRPPASGPSRRPWALLTLAGLLVALVAACGDDGEDTGAAGPSDDTTAATGGEAPVDPAQPGGSERDGDEPGAGGGLGAVVVDGTTYELVELRNLTCSGFAEFEAVVSGTTGDGYMFRADVGPVDEPGGAPTLSGAAWEGPEGSLRNTFTILDGEWIGQSDEGQVTVSEPPVVRDGDRVTGALTLIGGAGSSEVAFEVPIPAELAC